MSGKEQRVRHLAEKLKSATPAPGEARPGARERLMAKLTEMHDRTTPEDRARALVEEDPEKARRMAEVILGITTQEASGR